MFSLPCFIVQCCVEPSYVQELQEVPGLQFHPSGQSDPIETEPEIGLAKGMLNKSELIKDDK